VPTRSRTSTWFAAARQPRILGLLVLLLVAAGICVRLGAWQLDRAVERSERAALRVAQTLADASPVPLDDVVRPQTGFTQAMIGRRVEVTGEFVESFAQYLVPEIDAEGDPGGLVLAALRVGDAEGEGAILPVVRGRVDAEPDDLGALAVRLSRGGDLATPAGRVTLVGSLAGSEAAQAASGSDGTLGSISSGQLANLWDSPIYGGYLRVLEMDPPQTAPLEPAPEPSVPRGGLPLQNVAYALQWWIFGGFALAVWLRLVRDEGRRLRE
jgi:cytochrome oxidase assembly protein ShyY1